MATATLTKNGMINLPIEVRRKFNLKPGDKISFVDTGEGVVLVPVKGLFELVDEGKRDATVEMVRELIEEHKRDADRGG